MPPISAAARDYTKQQRQRIVGWRGYKFKKLWPFGSYKLKKSWPFGSYTLKKSWPFGSYKLKKLWPFGSYKLKKLWPFDSKIALIADGVPRSSGFCPCSNQQLGANPRGPARTGERLFFKKE